MVTIIIPEQECFDNDKEEFFTAPAVSLFLEHSLIAISKWEARYKVPFLTNVEHLSEPKHMDKFLFYVNCMSTKGEIPIDVLYRLSSENIKNIAEYISDKHTATMPPNVGSGGRGKTNIITSERIYALMAGYRIPHEYARWHLNNLLMVIDICAEMNEDPKKRKNRSTDPKTATNDYFNQNERLRKAGVPL